MFELRIRTDEETAETLRDTPVSSAEVPVSLVVDGTFVAGHATDNGYVFLFIGPFWSALLDGLPELAAGDSIRTEWEWGEYGFDAADSTVEIYYDEHRPEEVRGPRYPVPLEDFAAEVIDTAHEFFEFCRAVRPSFAGSESDEHYRSKVETARGWYRETYGTDPGT